VCDAQTLGSAHTRANTRQHAPTRANTRHTTPHHTTRLATTTGEVQLLSNHTQLHARSEFEDWDELERRRHLLR
jgi:hypothetical protein